MANFIREKKTKILPESLQDLTEATKNKQTNKKDYLIIITLSKPQALGVESSTGSTGSWSIRRDRAGGDSRFSAGETGTATNLLTRLPLTHAQKDVFPRSR